jgi:TIGR03009 family protein
MRRIIAALLPCVFVSWAAGSALAQEPDKRANPPATKGRPDTTPNSIGQGAPQNAQRFAVKIDDQRKMDNLLAKWQEQSANIKTLDAKFTREDFSATFEEKTVYAGRAILKSPDLAFLDFQKISENGKAVNPPVAYEQIRCTGKEVFHYRNPTHQVFVYPLAKEDRKRALEEGPLPFLFNMRADEAKKRYNLVLHTETPTQYIIKIEPRVAIDREAFIRADVALDKNTFLPDALRLHAPNGKDTQTYRFKGDNLSVETNKRVNEKNFQGFEPAGWKLIYNPSPDGTSQGPANAQAPTLKRPAMSRPGPSTPRR